MSAGPSWIGTGTATRGATDRARPRPQDARVRPVGFLPGDALLLGTTDPATGRESASVVGPDGSTTPLPGSLRVGSASEVSGLVSVQTRFTGDGSCWQVRDAGAGGAEVWQTCDYSLLGFSPDGRHLLGFTDYLTPDGSPTMAVLDAATGEPVVDFELVGARTGVVGINPEVAWEDDDTVVATLVTGDRQYVVRLGLDGTVERVGGEAVELDPGRRGAHARRPERPAGLRAGPPAHQASVRSSSRSTDWNSSCCSVLGDLAAERSPPP